MRTSFPNVRLYLLCVCLLAMPLAAAERINLDTVIEGLEQHYNRPETLHLEFEQTYSAPGRREIVETGEVYLRKPRRMRWVYEQPAGKLFVADGRDAYFYSPTANRVEKSPLRESGDLRTPLAFLIGRVDLRRDFDRFLYKPVGEDVYIAGEPKSARSPYSQVIFVVTPDYRIRRLEVHGQDESVMEFTFSDETVNLSLPDNLFEFQMPSGADLVEISEDEME